MACSSSFWGSSAGDSPGCELCLDSILTARQVQKSFSKLPKSSSSMQMIIIAQHKLVFKKSGLEVLHDRKRRRDICNKVLARAAHLDTKCRTREGKF
jgi:hypothetical protein